MGRPCSGRIGRKRKQVLDLDDLGSAGGAAGRRGEADRGIERTADLGLDPHTVLAASQDEVVAGLELPASDLVVDALGVHLGRHALVAVHVKGLAGGADCRVHALPVLRVAGVRRSVVLVVAADREVGRRAVLADVHGAGVVVVHLLAVGGLLGVLLDVLARHLVRLPAFAGLADVRGGRVPVVAGAGEGRVFAGPGVAHVARAAVTVRAGRVVGAGRHLAGPGIAPETRATGDLLADAGAGVVEPLDRAGVVVGHAPDDAVARRRLAGRVDVRVAALALRVVDRRARGRVAAVDGAGVAVVHRLAGRHRAGAFAELVENPPRVALDGLVDAGPVDAAVDRALVAVVAAVAVARGGRLGVGGGNTGVVLGRAGLGRRPAGRVAGVTFTGNHGDQRERAGQEGGGGQGLHRGSSSLLIPFTPRAGGECLRQGNGIRGVVVAGNDKTH